MSKLLRHYSEGNIYFITSITYKRKPLLKECYFELQFCFDSLKQEMNIRIISWIFIRDNEENKIKVFIFVPDEI